MYDETTIEEWTRKETSLGPCSIRTRDSSAHSTSKVVTLAKQLAWVTLAMNPSFRHFKTGKMYLHQLSQV